MEDWQQRAERHERAMKMVRRAMERSVMLIPTDPKRFERAVYPKIAEHDFGPWTTCCPKCGTTVVHGRGHAYSDVPPDDTRFAVTRLANVDLKSVPFVVERGRMRWARVVTDDGERIIRIED